MKNKIVSMFLCLTMITTVFVMVVPLNVNSSENGLVAYWDFDEGEGTIASDSIGSNDGEVHGASWVDGISGKALSYDGTDDYVETPFVPNFPVGQGFTISAWYKTSATGSYQGIVQVRNGAGDLIYLFFEPTYGLTFQVYDGFKAIHIEDGFSTYDGEWHHLTTVFDEIINMAYLYVDGQEKGYDNFNGDFDLSQQINPFFIGATNLDGNPTNYFSGDIDEVRIYDRALNSQEVMQLYEEFSINNLVAHWKFDEVEGNTAYDSINNNDGTIYGATRTSGISGNALSFDGSLDNYVKVPDSDSLDLTGDFTMEAWINVNAITNEGIILAKYDSPSSFSYQFGLYGAYGGKFLASFSADGIDTGSSVNNVFSTTTPELNTWYYLVAVHEGNELRMYVNGNLENTKTSVPTNVFVSDSDLYLGKSGMAHEDYHCIDGILDDVRIWNRALSSEEIQSRYGERIQATIDIDPDTLNLGSNGKWITAYIYFPDEWNPQLIDFPTIRISAINEDPANIPAVRGAIEWEPGGEYGEFDTRCMAKFSRAEVQELLEPGTYIFKVEGELLDGTPFEGYSDEIQVINPP